MGMFDGLRAAFKSYRTGTTSAANRVIDSIDNPDADTGLRQVSRVTPDSGEAPAKPAKPKKARSKDFLEMTDAERKAWLAHPTE